MTIILKFANGAEQRYEMNSSMVPSKFSLTSPEGAHFWFEFTDELPSGAIVFKETSRDSVRRALDGS